jgi:hypothetical protein
MSCTTCYKDWISCGVTTVQVRGKLLPNTSYTWVLTTPQGAKYTADITTNADGFFEVVEPVAGLFNPYAGPFTLEVMEDYCAMVSWNSSAYCDSYSCIEFEVKSGDANKNTIGCPCELL